MMDVKRPATCLAFLALVVGERQELAHCFGGYVSAHLELRAELVTGQSFVAGLMGLLAPFGSLVVWEFGNLGIWEFGILGIWDTGTLGF